MTIEIIQAPKKQLTAPIYATVRDFCAMTGIGRSTLYEAMKTGHVTARKVGSRTLVKVSSGLSWIENSPAYQPN